MKCLVTGSTGLIGSSLLPALKAVGHAVSGLQRGIDGTSRWDTVTGQIDPSSLKGADAVIHLAGANIGERRWTRSRKQLILESRVGPTTALCKFLANCDSSPSTLVVASAIGIYGDRGDAWLDESAVPGEGFLAEVVTSWEDATRSAAENGIRVVNLRFGIILAADGGALKRMLIPFNLGIGGPIGDGGQYWSWVGMDDVIGAMLHALETPSLAGPINVVSPNPVTNREFTRTLGRVLRRPAFLPLPRFAARLALGEMADELLQYSARVKPKVLEASGYQFRAAELDACLRNLLHR